MTFFDYKMIQIQKLSEVLKTFLYNFHNEFHFSWTISNLI